MLKEEDKSKDVRDMELMALNPSHPSTSTIHCYTTQESQNLTHGNNNNNNNNEDDIDQIEKAQRFAAVEVDELLLIPPPKSRFWLFATHAVGQFNEVAWKFSMSFFLSAFTNHESLVWVAAFGLSLDTAVTIGMPAVGSWIDSTTLNRLQIVQRTMAVETISIAIASMALILLLRSSSEHNGHVWGIYMAALNSFSAIAKLADQTLLVILERDWVVEMCHKDHKWLSATNAWMRRIDLASQVIWPVIIATVAIPLLVVHKIDTDTGNTREDWTLAACGIAVVNILALILQYIGTSVMYRLLPVLAMERFDTSESRNADEMSLEPSTGFFAGLNLYLSLPASGAGLALSFLYMNALTFGNGIMTAHLLHRAMSLESIGLWRGLAALAGLAGTWIFHWSPLSLRWTALWSILYECACLLVAALSVVPIHAISSYVGDDESNTFSTSLLIGGVLASRTGLWVFDLCVTQLQQETVPDHARGVVGGVQQSLNSFFGLGSFAIGLAFPHNFNVCVLTAFGSVCMAAVFYICSLRSLK